jgi:DNA polymerase (family 10)
VNNLDVARALYEIADLLELKDEDGFKVRAYRKAAQAIELLLEGVDEVARRGALTSIPGIGKAIAEKVSELLRTGHLAYLDDLRRAVPPGVGEMTRVPGLGAKTAALLYSRLGINSLDRLELAARQRELRDLPGMGPKKEAAILEALAKMRTRNERIPIGSVRPLAEALAGYLRLHPAVTQADLAGSIRRREDTVADIDLVVASDAPAAVIAYIKRLEIAGDVVSEAPDRIELMTSLGRRMDVRIVPPGRYALTLLETTGSREHLEALGPLTAAPTEAEIYAGKGLPYIEPELREGRGEVDAARDGRLPHLLTERDLKGDLHAHTHASDGHATALEMAQAARALGHQYLAICDHSQSLVIAGGLKPEQVRMQGAELRRLNKGFTDFRLLRGSEVDILRDGSLDFPDELLRDLDVVVASIHSLMKLDEQTQTERLVQAIKNPHVDIIAHPTGRVLGRRDPYALNIERVVDACARTGTALEISASPARLDLSDIHARLAKQRGVKLSIDTDAHTTHELELLPHGVGQARRAWVEAGDVVNAMNLAPLLAWLAKEKG